MSRPWAFVMVAVGVLLVAPQIVAERPWQALVAVGLALIVGGGATLTDSQTDDEGEREWPR